jgi:hypothetical protein
LAKAGKRQKATGNRQQARENLNQESEFIKFLVGQDKGEGEDTGDKEV